MKAIGSVVAFAIFVAIGLTAQSQTPPRDLPQVSVAGTASIAGVVVADDQARTPLRNVRVSIQRSGVEDTRTVSTDDQGRYQLASLPPGAYTMSFVKAPYVGLTYGAPKPGMPGRDIALADGEQFAAAPVALFRGAVIAGRLRDRNGRPVASTTVTATQFVINDGRRFPRSSSGASASAETNAHGEYRIFGLLPGEYVVYANNRQSTPQRETTAAEVAWTRQPAGQAPPPPRPFGYVPTFFGGSDSEGAAVVRLTRSEERLGLDMVMQAVPVTRVAGIVSGPGGESIRAPVMFLMPVTGLEFFSALLPLSATMQGDGSFSFGLVPRGSYRLLVATREPVPVMPSGTQSTAKLWADVPVEVGSTDVGALSIQLQPTLTVTGTMSVAATAPPAWNLQAARISLSQHGDINANQIASITSVVAADGSFKVLGLVPGRYFAQVTVPATAGTNWVARSAVMDDVDLMDMRVEIRTDKSGLAVTLTDTPTELSGTIGDPSGRPAELYVFAFSTNRAYWRMPTRRTAYVRSTEKGTYSIKNLPAGEYYLCALTELDLQMRFEPEYLQQLIGASAKITLAEGEKKQQNLQIAK